MAAVMEGMEQLIRTIDELGNGAAKRIAKSGVNAGLAVLARAARQIVNSSPASSELKAAARLTIGKRLLTEEGQGRVGKFGFGVGMRTRGKNTKAHKRFVAGQGGGHEAAGVGISATNIHWPVIGTGERWRGIKRVYAGRLNGNSVYRKELTGGARHRTGVMPPVFKGVIQSAVSSAGSAALEDCRITISMKLAEEAAKASRR